MRAEGVDYGKQLQDEMFPGRGGPDWEASVARIYDPAVLLKIVLPKKRWYAGLLALGDWPMARKELLTFKRLAEG